MALVAPKASTPSTSLKDNVNCMSRVSLNNANDFLGDAIIVAIKCSKFDTKVAYVTV